MNKYENGVKMNYVDINNNTYIRYMKNRGKSTGKTGNIKTERYRLTVQRLPEIVKKKDGIFVEKIRAGRWAIYRKIASFDGEILYRHFEVIKIGIMEINNTVTDFIEVYPGVNEFGISAWIYHSESGAYWRFKRMLKEENNMHLREESKNV